MNGGVPPASRRATVAATEDSGRPTSRDTREISSEFMADILTDSVRRINPDFSPRAWEGIEDRQTCHEFHEIHEFFSPSGGLCAVASQPFQPPRHGGTEKALSLWLKIEFEIARKRTTARGIPRGQESRVPENTGDARGRDRNALGFVWRCGTRCPVPAA